MEEINKTHRFNVGDFECLVIRDTISPMQVYQLFATTPPERVSAWLQKYDVPVGDLMETLCLLVRTAAHTVLIDTGWGNGPDPPYTGRLYENLRRAGLKPGEIDSIILSHGHPDHIGGITDRKKKLRFPRAHYFMLKKEWEFWTSGPDLSRLNPDTARTIMAYVRQDLMSINDHIRLIEKSDEEFLPGFQFIAVPGHTPGQGAVLISSGNEQLLCCADLFHHPLQVAYPKLCMAFDLMPGRGIKSRTEIIKRVAAAGTRIFACHFPFPGTGCLVPQGNTFIFQPTAVNFSK